MCTSLFLTVHPLRRGEHTTRHDVLWYYVHCDGEFASLKDFRKSLKRKDGFRVDHVGGLLAPTHVKKAGAPIERRKLLARGGTEKDFAPNWEGSSTATTLAERRCQTETRPQATNTKQKSFAAPRRAFVG